MNHKIPEIYLNLYIIIQNADEGWFRALSLQVRTKATTTLRMIEIVVPTALGVSIAILALVNYYVRRCQARAREDRSTMHNCTDMCARRPTITTKL